MLFGRGGASVDPAATSGAAPSVLEGVATMEVVVVVVGRGADTTGAGAVDRWSPSVTTRGAAPGVGR